MRVKNVSQELVEVTPKTAAKWLADASYSRQRRISVKDVNFLVDHMNEGTFRPGTQISFAAVKGGDDQLINGQHTLTAIVKSGKKQLLSVMYHNVDTQENVDWLYVAEDRHRPRSVFDTFNALQMLEKMGLDTKRQLNATGAAVKVILAGFTRLYTRIRDQDFMDAMLNYRDAALLYFRAIDGADSTIRVGLYRSSTLSIGLTTCKYCLSSVGHQSVVGFWEGVALDDGLCKGDPRKSLLYHLRNDVMSGKTDAASNRRRIYLRWGIYRVADCWKRGLIIIR